jgi:hypothetical protein
VSPLLLAVGLAITPPSPRWDAPTGCPDHATMLDRLLALAGRVPADTELHARAEVTGPPWHAVIELDRGGARERRELDARDCAGLLDAYAVVLAVAMDPLAVVQRKPLPFRSADTAIVVPIDRAASPRDDASARPPPGDASDPLPTIGRADASNAARPRRRAQTIGVRVGAGVGLGGWDRASGGVELAVAWTRGRLGLELVGRYWIRGRDALARGDAIEVELGTAAVRGCWVGGRRRWSLSGCLGIEAGDLVIHGVGGAARERADFPWVAPLLGGRVAYRLRAPLWLWLGLEAAVPVTRAQATLRAAQPVPIYHAGSPAVRGLAGLELRWSVPAPARARPP